MTGSLGNMISILIASRVMAASKVISTNEKHMLLAFSRTTSAFSSTAKPVRSGDVKSFNSSTTVKDRLHLNNEVVSRSLIE